MADEKERREMRREEDTVGEGLEARRTNELRPRKDELADVEPGQERREMRGEEREERRGRGQERETEDRQSRREGRDVGDIEF